MRKAIPFVLLCLLSSGCDVATETETPVKGEQYPVVTQAYKNNKKPKKVKGPPIRGFEKMGDRTYRIKAPGKKYDDYVLRVDTSFQQTTLELDMTAKKYKVVLDLKNNISMVVIDGELVTMKRPNGEVLVFGGYEKRNQKAINSRSPKGKTRVTKRYRSEVQKPFEIIFSFLNHLTEEGALDGSSIMSFPRSKKGKNERGRSENLNRSSLDETEGLVKKAGISNFLEFDFIQTISQPWKDGIPILEADVGNIESSICASNGADASIIPAQIEYPSDGSGGYWYRGQGYGYTASQACYRARKDANYKCTNGYCIGCEIILDCDAACAGGVVGLPYACTAGVSGKSCSSYPGGTTGGDIGGGGTGGGGTGGGGTGGGDTGGGDTGGGDTGGGGTCVDVTYSDGDSKTCCGTTNQILGCVESELESE